MKINQRLIFTTKSKRTFIAMTPGLSFGSQVLELPSALYSPGPKGGTSGRAIDKIRSRASFNPDSQSVASYGVENNQKQTMSVLHRGWQPLSTYDALEVKPRYAVFFFPAITIDECSLPEEVKTSRECASRECTHWHPIQDPSIIDAKEMPQPNAGAPSKQLTAKHIAALALLVNSKADFHAAIMAGANLSIMSALVKAGLATTLQNGGVKQWQITDLGVSVFREAEKAAPRSG